MESEIQLMELLFQVNRRVWNLFAPFFKGAGLSLTEVMVLVIMNKRKTSRVTRLATMIGVSPSTLTGILDRLVERRFLKRRQDPSDRRSVCMVATPKLESFIHGLTAPAEEMMQARLAPMAESRKKRLIVDLQFLLESLEEKGSADSGALSAANGSGGQAE
jgi:DNA-binding MarR family transcriptional regulator